MTPDKNANTFAGDHELNRLGETLHVTVYWSDDFGNPAEPTIGWAYGDGAEAEGGFRTSADALKAYIDLD